MKLNIESVFSFCFFVYANSVKRFYVVKIMNNKIRFAVQMETLNKKIYNEHAKNKEQETNKQYYQRKAASLEEEREEKKQRKRRQNNQKTHIK